nr:MAG TPA_asm: hypothetical protein [Caudoviricetes sp.]
MKKLYRTVKRTTLLIIGVWQIIERRPLYLHSLTNVEV